MARRKKDSGIYAFLEASGVLTGTGEEIAAMRKRYYAEYKAKWRKDKRAQEKEFTVAYTKQELACISAEARKRRISITKFIREAAYAYSQKRYLIDTEAVNGIRELLILNYSSLEGLAEDRNISERELLNKLEALETVIMEYITHPKSFDL